MFFAYRESTSKPATWSAPSTAQPIHHGPWTTARLPCKFLPRSSQSLYNLSFTCAYRNICSMTDRVTHISDTFLTLSLRCTAMMTYRCCRQEYRWWVVFGERSSTPAIKKHYAQVMPHCFMSTILYFILKIYFSISRIITASPLQLPQQHWLAETAAWQTTHTLVSLLKVTLSVQQLAALWRSFMCLTDEGTIEILWLSSQ